jgi:hypothetical protein
LLRTLNWNFPTYGRVEGAVVFLVPNGQGITDLHQPCTLWVIARPAPNPRVNTAEKRQKGRHLCDGPFHVLQAAATPSCQQPFPIDAMCLGKF